MEKDIEDAVVAMQVGDENKQEVRLAIDKFEEGTMVKPKSNRDPSCYVKYCRGCELVCPVGQ